MFEKQMNFDLSYNDRPSPKMRKLKLRIIISRGLRYGLIYNCYLACDRHWDFLLPAAQTFLLVSDILSYFIKIEISDCAEQVAILVDGNGLSPFLFLSSFLVFRVIPTHRQWLPPTYSMSSKWPMLGKSFPFKYPGMKQLLNSLLPQVKPPAYMLSSFFLLSR